MKALRISSSAVPLISCTLRFGSFHSPPDAPTNISAGDPPPQKKTNEMPLLLG